VKPAVAAGGGAAGRGGEGAAMFDRGGAFCARGLHLPEKQP
jgi:hypothetical protein